MAVQWLSHQTGLVVLAGCSGGLKKERGRERLKRPQQKTGGIMRGERDHKSKAKEGNKYSGKVRVKIKEATWMCGIKREHMSAADVWTNN